MGMAILETERLLLRPLSLLDAEEMFHNWANDPEVTKYMTWNPHTDVTMTEYVLGIWEKEYAKPDTVRFGIVKKDTGELFGSIDVVEYVEGVPEVGYCIGRRFWGHGYMTEAAGAMLRYLASLGHKKVIISAVKENIASNRVIQKLGLTLRQQVRMDFPQKGQTFDVNVYEKDL